jgi:hypothetical protein
MGKKLIALFIARELGWKRKKVDKKKGTTKTTGTTPIFVANLNKSVSF